MKEKPSLKLSKISRLEFISLVAPWLALSLPIFFFIEQLIYLLDCFFSSKWCRQTEGKKNPGYFCLFLQDIKPFAKHSIKTKVHFKNTILILGTYNPIPHSLKNLNRPYLPRQKLFPKNHSWFTFGFALLFRRTTLSVICSYIKIA